MKSLFFAFLAIALVAVVLLNPPRATLAQTEPAIPPGVSEESWIPLSDRAGILITRIGPRNLITTTPPRNLQGRVVIEIDGQWAGIDLINRGGITPLTTHP